MGKTGTYRVSPETGKVEKISDRIPGVSFDVVSLPRHGRDEGGYYSENLGCFVRSRRHKRDVLKRKGLAEVAERGSHRELSRPKPGIDFNSLL